MPTRAELEQAVCWEPGADVVPGQPEVTAYKQAARLHQAHWREARGYPMGTQPYKAPDHGDKSQALRPLGSRIDYQFAVTTKANLVTGAARAAADKRLAARQPHQTLNPQRLWCDLLSSMPLCFNLFGPLAEDLDLARRAVAAWFPDVPGTVRAVHLEWSPGRLDDRFLGSRTAFDAAIELDLHDGGVGILGIETKYHEHAAAEKPPSEQRLSRYYEISQQSAAFDPDRLDGIPGSLNQQIWQDHLLALSMLGAGWSWARFVVVHPAGNTSFATAVQDYRGLLTDDGTFAAATLEELVANAHALPSDMRDALTERYMW